MANNYCRAATHSYEYEGRMHHVSCELPLGHDGKHAAWTWETPPYPRVEWENIPDDDVFDVGEPLSHAEAARLMREQGADKARLDALESEFAMTCGGAGSFTVTMPDGHTVRLGLDASVTRAPGTTGPIPWVPSLREIADALIAEKQIGPTVLSEYGRSSEAK
jgi:hypothetical protein